MKSYIFLYRKMILLARIIENTNSFVFSLNSIQYSKIYLMVNLINNKLIKVYIHIVIVIIRLFFFALVHCGLYFLKSKLIPFGFADPILVYSLGCFFCSLITGCIFLKAKQFPSDFQILIHNISLFGN